MMPHAPDSGRAGTWLGVVLHTVGVAAGFATLAEWDHYREVLGWSELGPWDTLVVVWTLAAKSLWVLTPTLVLATVLVWGRWSRTAWSLVVAAGTVVFGWLAVDLRVHAATRNHASDYLAFLSEPNPWEWAGEMAQFLAPLLVIAAVAGLVQAGLAWIFLGVGRALSRRWLWLSRPVGVVLIGVAYLTALVGVVPAARSANRPLVLHQLGGAIPVPAFLGAKSGPPSLLRLDESLQRFNLEAQAIYRRHFERIARPRPADDATRLPDGPRPHVIVLVVESLRFDALGPQSMPRLDVWSRSAFRLERHFASANISHLGLFALLYGRHPLLYDLTLDAGAPPQLVHTLRRSGYRAAYFGSADLTWRRMEEFVNARHFDRVVFDTEGAWPQRDRRVMRRIAELLATSGDQPWVVVAFPTSTHYPYFYPPEYDRHTPTIGVAATHLGRAAPLGAFRREEFRQGLWNRYRNALAFLDDTLADLVTGLDPRRHVIVLTGDHGQSFFEDGAWIHYGPLSDVQTRVPMVIVGDGLPTGLIRRATSHVDVLPTLLHALAGRAVPIQGTQGRDLLDGEWADQVWLARLDRPARTVLVRGDGRLDIRLSLDAPVLFTLGLVDAAARPQSVPLRSEEVGMWIGAIADELERLGR